MRQSGLPRQAGQALLIVVLSMAVVLTVVLSIMSRSITDVSISTKEENAQRAFSAAEAGVEKALIIGSDIPQTDIGDSAKFEAFVSNIGQGSPNFLYTEELKSGDVATLWLIPHNTDGSLATSCGADCFGGRNIEVCWGTKDTGAATAETPAIETIVYYSGAIGNYTNTKVARFTSDPNSGRSQLNSFGSTGGSVCNIGGVDYAFNKSVHTFVDLDIPLGARILMARVRMLYNENIGHPVGFRSSDGTFPSQGKRIVSTGTSGEATRKIEVFETFAELPPIFDAVLFADTGGIVK